MAQTTPTEQTGKRLVFEDSIEVQAPISEVYRRWSDFTRFPDFMNNVEEVRPIGNNRYHWVARIFGIKQEWDAEVTNREHDRNISWQSVSGTPNSGSVTFTSLPDASTQVHLHLEYTSPAGKAGQVLDNITRTTQREVHEDLENFRRVVSGMPLREGEPTYHNDAQQVWGSLAAVVTFGVVGGTIAHYVIDNVTPNLSNPSSILTAPMAYVAGKGLGVARSPLPFSTGQSEQSKIASYALGVLAGGSLVAAAALRLMGRKQDALFVGQWTPTFLVDALVARLVGDSGVKTPDLAQKASWAFGAASLGSVLTSLYWHVRGFRKNGLFVGQWAPTLMIMSALSRLIREP